MAMFTSSGALVEHVASIVTSASTITLTDSSPTLLYLTGTFAQNIVLPNATTLLMGYTFIFYNQATLNATVRYNDTSTATTVKPHLKVEMRLLSNATQNGVWSIQVIGDPTVDAHIGAAEDGNYNDGLYTDFTVDTPVGTAVDRFNTVLKSIAPSPAPTLVRANFDTPGVSDALSFGPSYSIPTYFNSPADVNTIFPNDGASGSVREYGMFAAHASHIGTLANNVTATTSYPANSFGNGNIGTLYLYLNGVQKWSVDLSTFVSGSSVNGNGSGFTLTASVQNTFPDGSYVPGLYYRQGTFTISGTESGLRNGFNYVSINHNFNSTDHYIFDVGWIVDPDSNAVYAAAGILHNLSLTGLRQLSGVKYFTGGTAQYDVSIGNAYRDVYSSNGAAISFTTTNCTVPVQSIPVLVPPTTIYTSAISVTNAAVTINATNILNGSVTVGVNCNHPLKSSLVNGQPQSATQILLDSRNTASTDLSETFMLENIRVQSVGKVAVNNYAAQADLVTGVWDSTQSLVGADTGHNDGLLYYNLSCRYPTQGANSGNFDGLTNDPPSNVDYSAASGTRYVYVKLKNTSGVSKSNFKVNLTGTGTFSSSVPSGQNLKMEMKFPAGTISTATGWMDCYSDFVTGQTSDGSGARVSANGAGQAFGVDWGLTIGTKCVASNEYLVFRISAASAWTGSITNITLTWL